MVLNIIALYKTNRSIKNKEQELCCYSIHILLHSSNKIHTSQFSPEKYWKVGRYFVFVYGRLQILISRKCQLYQKTYMHKN